MTRAKAKPILGSTIANTGWLVGDNVIRIAVGLLVGIWIARYLGPAGFGLLSYAAAFVSLFSALSALGLDRIVIRQLVAAKLDASKVLGTALRLKVAGGLTVLVVSTAVAYLLNPDEKLTVILIAISALGTIAQAADVFDYHFQARIQSKYSAVARATAFHLLSAAKVGLMLLKAPLVAFALAGLVESILAGILLWIAYRRQSPNAGSWQWDGITARELLRESWSLMFAGVMITLYMRLDQVMLKSLSTPEEMGKYAGAVRLSEAWYFVLIAMSASVFPKLVDASSISEAHFNLIVKRFYSAMILVSYAFATALSLSSTPLSWLYGADFKGMEGMLFLCAWAGLFVGIGLARGAYLTAKGLNRFQLCATTSGAVVNIGLNLYLIPRYGGTGAALATLVSYAFSGYLSSFFYKPARLQGWIITKLLLPWNAWRSLDWTELLDRLQRHA